MVLLLVLNAGIVMDRESLIKALWRNTVVEEANLNVHRLAQLGSDLMMVENFR
jgi:DNA-binding winged helix-turn-helix (wHTH) protein